MEVGIDLGYSAVKVISENKTIYFPSVVGTPDRARFTANGTVESIILAPDGMEKRLVGEGAILQSRFIGRREDRGWIESDEYKYLMACAFTELTKASRVNFKVVTGLPVRYFEDKDIVKNHFLGEHRIAREGRTTQVFNVSECRVIPQPFGTVLSKALDSKGRIQENVLATGDVGIIDIGGKTTNLLSVHRLAEIGKDTTSISIGAWDIMRVVREYLAQEYKDLDLRDHEIITVIREKRVKYFGEYHDLSSEVTRALKALGSQILAEATHFWNKGGGLDKILVSGGGALLLGEHIVTHFKHAIIVDNPVYANSQGYYRFCQRL